MTRIVQCGWELGDIAQLGTPSIGSSGGVLPTVVASTPTPRSGAYCLKCAYTGVTNSGINVTTSRLTVAHASQTEVWYAFGFYYTHSAEPASPQWVLAHAVDASSGNVNVLLACDSGTLRAYVATAGGTAPAVAQVTLLGASGASLSSGAWHLIEIRLIASTGAGGTCQVYQDGAMVINATGARTAQTAATYGALVLGMTAWQATSSGMALLHAFDDLRIQSTAGSVNNGRPGDESIRLLVPNGAGDLTQLTRGGTDSGSNWGQVDEIPPTGAVDYVASDTVGQADLYALSTVAIASVSAIEVIVQGFNAGGGGTINLPIKTPAGQSDGAAATLTATPTYYKRLLEADPTGGAVFDQTKLDALQAGIKVAS